MGGNPFSLDGRVAIVTGASSGFGVEFSLALSRAGADVVATARDEARLKETQRRVEAMGRRCLPIVCDITDYAAVAAMMRRAWAWTGTVDILVNNAGILDARALRSEHSEPEMFAALVQTDLIGLWHCCHAAAQHMLRQGHGNIINISSVAGIGGGEGRTPGYAAAKGAVNQLTQLLACEWGDRGVRVNALAPHVFDSPMTHDALVQSGVMDYLEGRIPMRRIGQLDDLEGPIVFLASDASRYMTGVVLPLDGGLTAARGYTPNVPWDAFDPAGRGRPLMPGTPWDGG
jgi:gluconate 5-dehydrogenase